MSRRPNIRPMVRDHMDRFSGDLGGRTRGFMNRRNQFDAEDMYDPTENFADEMHHHRRSAKQQRLNAETLNVQQLIRAR